MKANFAERVIQTLKKSLWEYMCTKINYRYIDVLKDIVHSCNNTKHHTTDMKPSKVTKGHVERCLWWHLYNQQNHMRNCIKHLEFLLHIRRMTKYVYLIWSKPSKEHTMKSGQEKYSKWFNLLNVLEYVNIVFVIKQRKYKRNIL